MQHQLPGAGGRGLSVGSNTAVILPAGCVQNRWLIGPFDMDDDITPVHLHRRYELMTLINHILTDFMQTSHGLTEAF